MKKTIFTLVVILGLFFSLYGAPGDLDLGFDGDGKASYRFQNHDYRANDTAIQPDGKIVLAGLDGFPFADFAVVRFNADGSADAGFGNGGRVVTPVVADDDEILAVVIQPDGKIVVAGYAQIDPNNSSFNDFAIVRYNPNGTLDASFDGDGIFTTSFGTSDFAYAVNLQPDGKILAAGITQEEFGTRAALLRLNSDGSLDSSFDTDGKVIFSISQFDTFRDIVVQPDGKIVLVGTSGFSGALLVRYNADGTLDPSFDGDGISTFDGGWQFVSVARQTNGKLVAAGYLNSSQGALIARYNSDGTLDDGFSGDGLDVITFPGEQLHEFFSVAIQTNGKIVAAGGNNDFHIARYNPDGTLDSSSWGTGGIVNTDLFSGSSDLLNAIAIQPDGKIVAAGTSNSSFAAARYLGDLAPPTSANVAVSGRAVDARGQGISRATVALTDASGNRRTVLTGSFGFYSFREIPAGQIYTISVSHKRYVFSPDTQILNVSDSLSDVDFSAAD